MKKKRQGAEKQRALKAVCRSLHSALEDVYAALGVMEIRFGSADLLAELEAARACFEDIYKTLTDYTAEVRDE